MNSLFTVIALLIKSCQLTLYMLKSAIITVDKMGLSIQEPYYRVTSLKHLHDRKFGIWSVTWLPQNKTNNKTTTQFWTEMG